MITEKSPIVSIIIPTYNYGHLIHRTIQSILSQTFKNWECIIIDDGSTDDTSFIIGELVKSDSRFRYFSQNNRGVSAARNVGLKAARGEYLQFIDADDLIQKEKLQAQIQFLIDNPEIDIVYGNAKNIESEALFDDLLFLTGDSIDWIPRIIGSANEALVALVQSTFPPHCALIRRRVINDVGLFDEDLHYCEDWHYWIRCAAAGKRFHYADLKGSLSLYRRHPDSACAKQYSVFLGQRTLRHEIGKIVVDPEVLRLNQSLAATLESYQGVQEVKKGNRLKGMRLMLHGSYLSMTMKEKLKWFYCAIMASWIPGDKLEHVVITPFARSVRQLFKSGKAA